MGDFSGQSTDRLRIDTSPDTPRVLLRGSTTITTAVTGGAPPPSYYYGESIIDLSAYSFTNSVPEVIAYTKVLNVDSYVYTKIPYIGIYPYALSSEGYLDVSDYINYKLSTGSAKASDIEGLAYTLRLTIFYISKTNGASITVDYQVRSSRINT